MIDQGLFISSIFSTWQADNHRHLFRLSDSKMSLEFPSGQPLVSSPGLGEEVHAQTKKVTCLFGHVTSKVYMPCKIYMPRACGHAVMSTPVEEIVISIHGWMDVNCKLLNHLLNIICPKPEGLTCWLNELILAPILGGSSRSFRDVGSWEMKESSHADAVCSYEKEGIYSISMKNLCFLQRLQ